MIKIAKKLGSCQGGHEALDLILPSALNVPFVFDLFRNEVRGGQWPAPLQRSITVSDECSNACAASIWSVNDIAHPRSKML